MNKYNSKKDILLMTYLRSNARENLTRISRLTHIPVSTIFDKLRDFESGLISKHTSLVDFRKLGFDVKVNMLFKIQRDGRESFRKFLMNHQNVNSIFRVNNGYDFLVEGIFVGMDDLQQFMEDIEQYPIEDKQELFVLEDLKREGFLSDQLHAELLFANV